MRLKEMVKKRVFEELEGQCLGKNGWVICIIECNDDDIIPGKVDNDTGAIIVSVEYTALLLRPFRNEVFDAVCSMATTDQGIMCKVGPCEIFISRHQMPEDLRFDAGAGDCWVTDDKTSEIREGTIVRLRVLGTVHYANSIRVVGTINDPFLGQFEE